MSWISKMVNVFLLKYNIIQKPKTTTMSNGNRSDGPNPIAPSHPISTTTRGHQIAVRLRHTGQTTTESPSAVHAAPGPQRLFSNTLRFERGRDCMGMAEAELHSFTAIMDSLVRISVSMTFILLWDLFQPRVLRNDIPASESFILWWII